MGAHSSSRLHVGILYSRRHCYIPSALSRHVCGLPEAATELECLHITVPWAGTSFMHPMPSVGIPLRVITVIIVTLAASEHPYYKCQVHKSTCA